MYCRYHHLMIAILIASIVMPNVIAFNRSDYNRNNFFRKSSRKNTLTVATYSIWNDKYHWDIRKLRIAEIIKHLELDIIALQDVRYSSRLKTSQAHQLQKILPRVYKYVIFQPMQRLLDIIAPVQLWDIEGFAFISRHHLTLSASTNLTLRSNNSDFSGYSSSAIATVKMYIPGLGNIDVSTVVLSDTTVKQCKEIRQLYNYFRTNLKSSYQILMGDFKVNTHQESIIDALLNGQIAQNSSCSSNLSQKQQSTMKWKDAWIESGPSYAGITYSPVPTIGYKARRDRILLSPTLYTKRALLQGYGDRYKSRFMGLVIWRRFIAVMNMAYSQFRDSQGDNWFYYGSICSYRCGNGKPCRCGVCLSPHGSFCYLDQCTECSMTRFLQVTLILICFCISSLLGLFLILRMLINFWFHGRYKLSSFTCSIAKNWYYLRPTRRWFTFSKLPSNIYHVISCIIRKLANTRKLQIPKATFRLGLVIYFLVLSVLAARWGVYDTIHLVKTVSPEEQFPADHLCLSATIEAA